LVLLTEYYWGGRRKDEMGQACSTHLGRDKKCICDFLSKYWKERGHLEDLGLDGWITLKRIFGDEG